MGREARALLACLLALSPAVAKISTHKDAEHYTRVAAPIVPTPRSRVVADAPPPVPEAPMDLSHALPGNALANLPSSAQELQSLSSQLKQGQPQLSSAKQKSETLAAQAVDLRRKLVDTAARIESLEREKISDYAAIVTLKADDDRLSAGFANDRVAVTRLIAVLERLQHDMPPALAMRPDDALGAARGAMLIGATLPPVYAQAAGLSRRIAALKQTRAALEQRRAQAQQTVARLDAAHDELGQLLDQKEREAAGATQTYDSLKIQLTAIAAQAADFQALLAKVKALRQSGAPAEPGVVMVTAQNAGSLDGPGKGSLLEPVVGVVVVEGTSASNPGLSYATRPGAQVITPADGKVLYAGPYHKSGQVLILEITTGYDLVLAGLGRVTVKSNDQLLAGEPVGTMPADLSDDRLYFELRRGGHGLNPAPWLKLDLRKAKT